MVMIFVIIWKLNVIDETERAVAIPETDAAACDEEFIELQPGLAIAASTASSVDAHSEKKEFPGDNKYIHFNCQLDGILESNVREKSINTSPGGLTMGCSAGEHFNIQNSPDFRNIAVMVTPELLETITDHHYAGIEPEKEMKFFMLSARPNQQITLAATQLSQLMKSAGRQKLLLHSTALEFLHWQLNVFYPATENKEVLTLRERRLLELAREYLLSDLSTPPTIEALSKQVGLNQCKLKQGFRLLFGNSIYAYFLTERMKKARYLLHSNNVTETATMLGYSNVSHFSAAFQKQFGILPKDARQRMICAEFANRGNAA